MSETIFDTFEEEETEKCKKNCHCCNDQIEVGVNLSENYVESDIIGDRIMFSRNDTFDISQIIADFERVVKEKEDNDKNNI
jgi:hypothetical protein